MVRRIPNASNVIVTGGTRERYERFEVRLDPTAQGRDTLSIDLVEPLRKVGAKRRASLDRDEIEALRDLLNTYFPKEAPK